jgi:methanol--5-hydroxybenzimidazolylcobamide Co-methyltransferase
MTKYTSLAISDPNLLIFGHAPKPVTTKRGLVIGGGTVYPELNFTLPAMEINQESLPKVNAHFAQIIEEACQRAVELHTPGLVVEFELLPPMTLQPEWGADITAILSGTLDKFYASDGLKSALRVTPNDIRENHRPPVMRSGDLWENMVRSFELNAQAGAEMLSIESTGGKEIHDDGILNADMQSVAFGLGILGARDMAFLWDMIVGVSNKYGVIPAGDSACGFGNTAMVLAEKRYIPRVWAATIRVMTVARALVAHERGALGPGKDCAYENPYLKAITGCPMSGEGSEAACAHMSPVGNIARTTSDIWSNESVQNIKLLGGMAPIVSLEQLVYATRLLNTASSHGPDAALTLRDWYAESDVQFDPQAYVLRPDVVIRLAKEIIAEPTAYLRTRRAALATIIELRQAAERNEFILSAQDESWLELLSDQADELPEDENELIKSMVASVDNDKVLLDQYEIDVKNYK